MDETLALFRYAYTSTRISSGCFGLISFEEMFMDVTKKQTVRSSFIFFMIIERVVYFLFRDQKIVIPKDALHVASDYLTGFLTQPTLGPDYNKASCNYSAAPFFKFLVSQRFYWALNLRGSWGNPLNASMRG